MLSFSYKRFDGVAPITTTIRDIPSEVFLTPEDGLLTECAANMDSIQTVPKHKPGSLIAYLPSERMEVELS